jgi:hypothetical protein
VADAGRGAGSGAGKPCWANNPPSDEKLDNRGFIFSETVVEDVDVCMGNSWGGSPPTDRLLRVSAKF